MEATKTIDSLQQHELVILRRLRNSPLTEFELVAEIAEHSGHTSVAAAGKIVDWLEELKAEGLIFAGQLSNIDGTVHIHAAALTKLGRELVGG